ncbi:MAG: cytochrome b/b6 domain-containing protein [Acidisphaera sp.]|nr:cytochrome b/b6 domain-containing protein [Acidisphaera sp.]
MSLEPHVQRHPLARRVCHWLNALAMLAMIGSGWRIYNWYPALPASFEFPVWGSLGGQPPLVKPFSGEDGLANALAWHFGAMWLLVINFTVMIALGFVSRHYQRDFLPIGPRSFLRDFRAALTGKLSHALGTYNAVQRVFYWGVLLLTVLMVASGLAIWKPVQFAWLDDLFGNYEIARVVHFCGMAGIVGFLLVHIALTILVPKTLVAMVTGEASEPADAHGASHVRA